MTPEVLKCGVGGSILVRNSGLFDFYPDHWEVDIELRSAKMQGKKRIANYEKALQIKLSQYCLCKN